MAYVEATVVAALKANGTLASLISSQVYPQIAPAGSALPFITYQTVSDAPASTLAGSSGLKFARISFSCFGSSYGEAKQVGALVRSTLDGNGSALWENTFDRYDAETRTHYTIVDVLVSDDDDE